MGTSGRCPATAIACGETERAYERFAEVTSEGGRLDLDLHDGTVLLTVVQEKEVYDVILSGRNG